MGHSHKPPPETWVFAAGEHREVEEASSHDAARRLLDDGWDWVGISGDGQLLLAHAETGGTWGDIVIAEGGAVPEAHGIRIDRPGKRKQLRWFATARAADADFTLLIGDSRSGHRGGFPSLLSRIENGAVAFDVLVEPLRFDRSDGLDADAVAGLDDDPDAVDVGEHLERA